MTISREKIKDLYQSGAKHYDFATILFRLAGLRMKKYRAEVIEILNLKKGDIVVELGCGTGLNFPLVMEKIGPEGHLIGVDITPGMLEVAQGRIRQNNWSNVELIESDIARYEFPKEINAVFATGVFGYIPEHDQIIERAFNALVQDGRIAILDGKRPERLPASVFHIVLALGAQYGYTEEYFDVAPWKSVEKYFANTVFQTRYGGMIYEASGVKL